MSDPNRESPPRPQEPPDDARGKSEYLALGLGCLVSVVFIAAVFYYLALRDT